MKYLIPEWRIIMCLNVKVILAAILIPGMSLSAQEAGTDSIAVKSNIEYPIEFFCGVVEKRRPVQDSCRF